MPLFSFYLNYFSIHEKLSFVHQCFLKHPLTFYSPKFQQRHDEILSFLRIAFQMKNRALLSSHNEKYLPTQKQTGRHISWIFKSLPFARWRNLLWRLETTNSSHSYSKPFPKLILKVNLKVHTVLNISPELSLFVYGFFTEFCEFRIPDFRRIS